MQTLLALACLGIRYDTKVELLVEPLKIHIRRNVHRRMKQTLPMAHMVRMICLTCPMLIPGMRGFASGPQDHKACIAALRRSIDQAIDRLEFDLDASAAFPRQLDLPLFTARLRYTLIADHMLRMFTGPGVLPYTTGVMVCGHGPQTRLVPASPDFEHFDESDSRALRICRPSQDMQDRMQDLHNLMTDANISATPLEATTEDGRNYVDLLDINRVLGRSLLKWVRDIG